MTDELHAAGDMAADDRLLAELREAAARLDPVPADMAAMARAAIVWRTIDTELAELTADSGPENEDERLVTVRGASAPTLLSFDAPSLSVELEVTVTGRARRLLGQLVPPQPGEVEVRHEGGTITVAADEMGRFAVEALVPGPTSVRCRAASAAAASIVDTDWFLT